MEEKEGGRIECGVCGSDRVIYDPIRGELVCMDCGSVIDERLIDQRYEKRIFTEEDWRNIRIGPKLSNPLDKLSSTEIGMPGDIKDPSALRKFMRLRMCQRQVVTRDKGLQRARMEIERLCRVLGLPQVVKEEASMLYKKASESGLVKGRSVEGMATACLLAICKLRRMGVSLNDLEKMAKVKRRDISRCYRVLREGGLVKRNAITGAECFLPKLRSELGLSMDAYKIASEIVQKARERHLGIGTLPEGIAAAAIYIASILTDEKRTQRSVARAAGVTEVTLRNRYREIVDGLDIVVRI